MKIVLLTLSGDPAAAREDLEARFPDATVESLSREELEQRSARSARQPPSFAQAGSLCRGHRAFDVAARSGCFSVAGSIGRRAAIDHSRRSRRLARRVEKRCSGARAVRLAWEFINSGSVLRYAKRELRTIRSGGRTRRAPAISTRNQRTAEYHLHALFTRAGNPSGRRRQSHQRISKRGPGIRRRSFAYQQRRNCRARSCELRLKIIWPDRLEFACRFRHLQQPAVFRRGD